MTLTESNDMNDIDEIIDTEAAGDSGGVVPEELIDAVMASVNAGGIELLGENGAIAELTKRILERGLNEELAEHLGYEAGERAGRGSGNNRNGTSAKTVLTEIGAVDLAIPRDRNGSFEPQLVPKHSRRMEQFNTNIVHLYAQGTDNRTYPCEARKLTAQGCVRSATAHCAPSSTWQLSVNMRRASAGRRRLTSVLQRSPEPLGA